jgi:hypothetical protein
MADRWWQNKPDERYWLEATDREDIGADLKAPDADASGLPGPALKSMPRRSRTR